MKPKYQRTGKTHILYDGDRFNQINEHHFSIDWWRDQRAVVGMARGRGRTALLRDGAQGLVLRHYRRGGMVARISEDCYLWAGLSRSRPWREWALLWQLVELELPIPRPVAVRLQRQQLCYRADILMERLPGQPLAQHLVQQRVGQDVWTKLGDTIRRFHDTGVDHADLNANNILLDEQSAAIGVIDFDQGVVRSAPGHWQEQNLNRLLRSLRKLNGSLPQFHFLEQRDWDFFLAGYRGKRL